MFSEQLNDKCSAANDISYAYNNLADIVTEVDQNGTTHAFSYDPLDRLTLDAVATLGTGVDGSIRAIGYSYNTQDLPFNQTSYSDAAATTVVNEVEDVYNGLGQLTTQYQEHGGAVNTSTSAKIQYAFSSIPTGSLVTQMTYPNGRILHFGYDNDALDTAIGRIDYQADDNGSGSAGSHLVDYTYQGLSEILGQAQGNGVTLTESLDDLGRISEMNYVKSATSTDDFQYGYDRNGNVLYKKNVLSSSFSELYHANAISMGDDNTAYDPLNRLTGFQRGTLSASTYNLGALDTVTSLNTTSGVTGNVQTWALDAVGNQPSVSTDGTTVTHTDNAQNELTAVGSTSITYDASGNMTSDQNGNLLTYDAWNRLSSDSDLQSRPGLQLRCQWMAHRRAGHGSRRRRPDFGHQQWRSSTLDGGQSHRDLRSSGDTGLRRRRSGRRHQRHDHDHRLQPQR